MIFDTKQRSGIEETKEKNEGNLPKKDDIVVVRGVKKGGDCVFAQCLSVQKTEVFDRISQLKNAKTKKTLEEVRD